MLLISGATGFVGRHLLLDYLRRDQSVIGLYRSDTKKKATEDFLTQHNINPTTRANKLHWRKAEMTDWVSLERAFEGATQVFHCAALVSLYPGKETEMMHINVTGTAQMVDLAKKNNIQWFGHISSIAALGGSTEGKTIDENNLWNKEDSHSAYAYTKQLAELEVWRGFEEGLRGCILNPGVILGPGGNQSPLAQFRTHTQKPICWIPTGGSGFVGIEDVVLAARLVQTKQLHRERFVLVASNWSYANLFDQLRKLLPSKGKKKTISERHLTTLYWFEKILALLGRQPRLSPAMIRTLCDMTTYDGSKIEKQLNDFSYQPLEKLVAGYLR